MEDVPSPGEVTIEPETARIPALASSKSATSPLLVILGPTGSGKSELALCLAGEFRGEIVNFDSVQVYQGLDIGSAKIPDNLMRGIPHHLINVISPNDEMTAGAFSNLARPVLRDICLRRALPVLAGGTGLYLRALLDGLSPAPVRDSQLRRRLKNLADRRPGFLHRFLRRCDPFSAGHIHPNDHQKLIRAIELNVLSSSTASQIQSRPRESLQGFTPFKIGLLPNRDSLYEHLNRRTAQMFKSGLLEETRTLLRSGVSRESKALQSLGYKQAVRVLEDNLDYAAAVLETQIKTRQYAKRQLTWFRADKAVHWLYGFGSEPEVQRAALHLTRSFLGQIPEFRGHCHLAPARNQS